MASEDELGRLLPGWIEPGTRRRLAARAEGSGRPLAAVVEAAWRAGDLHHEAGMWWVHPGDAAVVAVGAAVTASAAALTTAARMRELCEQGRPEEALGLGYGAVAGLLPGSAGDDAREADLGVIGIATLFALVDAGRVHAALPAAASLHAETVERGAIAAQGWCALARASALLVTGRTLDAREGFTEAVLIGRWTADAPLVAEARRALAFTYTALRETEPDWPEPSLPAPAADGLSGPDHGRPGDSDVRAAAWADPSPAHLHALEVAAEDARRVGRYGVSALLASDLALLGDAPAGLALLQRMGPLDGDLLPQLRPMAEAIAARDADGLAAHADRLESMGVVGLAAVLTLVAVAYRLDAGEDGTAVRDLLVTANRRAGEVQLGESYLEPFRRLLPLREREVEIAGLAAEGLTNKEIAARLVLSTRTVENHLYRVYDKLGISGRDELRRFLAGG